MSFRHFIAAACVLATPAALACPTCSCGDYTLTLMGAEKSFPGRLRMALDWDSRSEEQGSGASRATLAENRYTLAASYAFTGDLSAAVRLPYSSKSAKTASLGSEEAAGLGDADLLGRYTLGKVGETTARHLWGLQAGTRIPTSSEQRANGVAVDIDAQPGTGQWAPLAGLWYSYFRYPLATYVTIGETMPLGEGYQGLDQGNALLASVTSQYALSQNWSAQLGVESRFAKRNTFYGVADEDSGGTAAFLTPGVVFSPDLNVLIHLSAQIPVVSRLHGEQDERGDIRLGVAFDLGGES